MPTLTELRKGSPKTCPYCSGDVPGCLWCAGSGTYIPAYLTLAEILESGLGKVPAEWLEWDFEWLYPIGSLRESAGVSLHLTPGWTLLDRADNIDLQLESINRLNTPQRTPRGWRVEVYRSDLGTFCLCEGEDPAIALLGTMRIFEKSYFRLWSLFHGLPDPVPPWWERLLFGRES